MKFNFEKYLHFRQVNQNLPDEIISQWRETDTMKEVDGMDMEEVWKRKGACLKQWCDTEEK